LGCRAITTADPNGGVGIRFNWLGRILWEVLVNIGNAIPLRVSTGP